MKNRQKPSQFIVTSLIKSMMNFVLFCFCVFGCILFRCFLFLFWVFFYFFFFLSIVCFFNIRATMLYFSFKLTFFAATVTVGNTSSLDVNMKGGAAQGGHATPSGQSAPGTPAANSAGVPPCASPTATTPQNAQPGSGAPAISPAAATLKQMAEKHNSQREQLQQQHSQGNSPASASQGPQGQPGTPQGKSNETKPSFFFLLSC